jgi:hypothetical protein
MMLWDELLGNCYKIKADCSKGLGSVSCAHNQMPAALPSKEIFNGLVN